MMRLNRLWMWDDEDDMFWAFPASAPSAPIVELDEYIVRARRRGRR